MRPIILTAVVLAAAAVLTAYGAAGAADTVKGPAPAPGAPATHQP
jgi:Spy/CpxP family protein refolding chaperone